MSAADVVLLASGTAVLEAALLGKPTVAAYKVSYLTYFIAKTLRLVKLQYYTLPNLLTKEPYVPEFIQGAATAEAIAECVANMLGDRAWRALITDRFAKLRAELALGADGRAADAVIASRDNKPARENNAASTTISDYGPVAGVDEAGRGPLAGPVVAAAVILHPRRPIAGLDDSKEPVGNTPR